MAKRRQIIIRTPFPKTEEVIKELGITKKEAKIILKMVDKILDNIEKENKKKIKR